MTEANLATARLQVEEAWRSMDRISALAVRGVTTDKRRDDAELSVAQFLAADKPLRRLKLRPAVLRPRELVRLGGLTIVLCCSRSR